MTTVQIYRNKRNPNKYIEIHNDGHYHNSLKQYMYWDNSGFISKPLQKPVKNLLGDKCLHRWRIKNLKVLLEDYDLVVD